jgi:hypothetical protein
MNALNRAWMNKHFWVIDNGPLVIRDKETQIDRSEFILQVTLLGLSGSAVSLNGDLAKMSSDDRFILASIFPQIINGIDSVNIFESTQPELAVVQLTRLWGRWQIAAMFNWSDAYVERDLPTSLHLDIQNDYHLVDFWEQRYFRISSGNAWPVLHLDPHSVTLLALRPVIKDTAHIVGTSFHISQGGEIVRCQIGDCSIEMDINLQRTAKGSVWLALPAKPVKAVLNNQNVDPTNIRTVSQGIYEVKFVLRTVGTLQVSW